MARSRFEDILRSLHFLDNTKGDRIDKGYKFRSLINHFDQSFSNVSNDDSQSVDKHIGKIKCQSSVKQYFKNKPIK